MTGNYATIYRKDTGEIVESGWFSVHSEDIEMNYAARLNAIGGSTHDVIDGPSDPSAQYVVVVSGIPAIVPRPTLQLKINKKTIVADGQDSITVDGLPSPCPLAMDAGEPEQEAISIKGGKFIFVADTPGIYRFLIDKFPFLPVTLEFTAT